ncbi:TatD family hydrolase [Hymenobacter qilianensis]|uniref:TatD family hydrolase n=2 Tax=Hymenobacter qilianensis TaxID=1385715 RepID=A0ACB5PRU5_9BACT|nr:MULTISPECIES: TatD family hydrolase [Hymenobacter]MBC6607545.1 TatD family hydrolase [Hymenobacter sp. BT188]QNP52284.1 TatD family hydrolase [Hymenobacter qilianensis]GGF66125.1 TatD family hydrolase [Hymenobacter qilianensis]
MHLTDSHAHIYSEQFKTDRDATLHRAFEAGVTTIVMPNIDHTSVDSMLETEARFPRQCFAMMGLHPCSVGKHFEKELYQVEDWLGKRPFAAVGECGLDLHWDKTFFAQQQEALRVQIGLAKKFKLPLVLHTREAFTETADLIEEAQDGSLGGVFHCFSGTKEEAERAIKLGFKLGIGGVATFKNGGSDKVLPDMALEHLLLETDCPYLAPVPHRGKRNEPGYLPLIARRVAELLQKDVEEVAAATTRNAQALFNL